MERTIDRNNRFVLRHRKSENEKDKARMKDRERKSTSASNKPKEDYDYDTILQKQRKQNLRSNRSGKQHLKGNLKGMQLLNSFGRLREFSTRDRKKDDITKWRIFLIKSPRHH